MLQQLFVGKRPPPVRQELDAMNAEIETVLNVGAEDEIRKSADADG